MVLKIILGILAYFVIGALFCECLIWMDRNLDTDDLPFFGTDPDETEIAFTVVLWPLLFVIFAMWFVILRLPYLFFKGFMTLLTALVYTVRAYLDNKGGQHDKDHNRMD